MFDLAWSEIAVIGLVAVLVLGPKELPQAMRTMSKVLRKMRSLTSELQGHMNEIVREAELDEVRQSIKKLSSTNLKAELSKAVDPTGELSKELNQPLIAGEATPAPATETPGETTAGPPVDPWADVIPPKRDVESAALPPAVPEAPSMPAAAPTAEPPKPPAASA